MATKGKESAQGKEKRGISQSPHQATRRSPSPSTTASSDHKHGTTQSEKRIPNYLKPTISSSHDPSLLTKKQTSNTAQKPLLTRRRSLDKPPSASQVPKRNSPSPSDRNLRSATVLPKSTTRPKPSTERLWKAPNKSHSFSARSGTVKKSTSTTTKKPNNVKKAPSSVCSSDAANSSRAASEQGDHESSLSEVEKEMGAKVGSHSEGLAQIPILEENEDVDMLHAELDHEEEELLNSSESSNIREHENASLSSETKEPVAETHVEETRNDHHEGEEEHTTEEINKNNPNEIVASEPKSDESVAIEPKSDESIVNEPKIEESVVEEPKVEKSIVDEPKVEESEKKEEQEEPNSENSKVEALDEKVEVEEKEGVDEGSQTVNSKEIEEEEGVSKEAKQEAKSQGGPGKKDSQASNEVIEETASKLLEKRKHKVQALVGAFETVISRQEPEA